jgi:hypothetical protein
LRGRVGGTGGEGVREGELERARVPAAQFLDGVRPNVHDHLREREQEERDGVRCSGRRVSAVSAVEERVGRSGVRWQGEERVGAPGAAWVGEPHTCSS